ncbi:Pyrroline-5-carboxylate reductase [Sterolibacterium denitrificans]|uniref:Pyrroline-5-carboxylate reductase n=1 Tax=Sterolibacterium denitrificans TaxID=157592 RepID=A0A7Z7HP70_9PROT|nr:pyrroline-5-carboxylate reductase [Sterolibacterium denitrificans]SMB21193.1 Pyrroline-5-carboxylate reductase [Sterolibacterium denitrificans]
MKITFLGGGNMANALIGGLRKQGYSAAGIQVVEPLADNREKLTTAFGVRCCPALDAAALHCEVLVLAVKPQQMHAALAPLAGQLQNQLVISIAAGLNLADISRWLGGYRQLVRCMPNTPALIGAGITGLYADPAVNREGREMADRILRAVGSTLWLTDEAQMDAVTAISGSGPAYVFYFIEALQQSGAALGLDAAAARRLAVETFVGAARLAGQSEESVAELRQRVTSKGGTTEAALNSFEADGIAAAIARGARAAAARGRALGEEMGRD